MGSGLVGKEHSVLGPAGELAGRLMHQGGDTSRVPTAPCQARGYEVCPPECSSVIQSQFHQATGSLVSILTAHSTLSHGLRKPLLCGARTEHVNPADMSTYNASRTDMVTNP